MEMTIIELKGLDRIIPRLVYCMDKLGLKLRSKRILNAGCRLCDYIMVKYGAPRDRVCYLGMTYIQIEE